MERRKEDRREIDRLADRQKMDERNEFYLGVIIVLVMVSFAVGMFGGIQIERAMTEANIARTK